MALIKKQKNYLKIISALLAGLAVLVGFVIFYQNPSQKAAAQTEGLICSQKIPIGEALDKTLEFLNPIYINLQNIQLTALSQISVAEQMISTIGEEAENCTPEGCQPNCVNTSIQGGACGMCGLGKKPEGKCVSAIGIPTGVWISWTAKVCIPACYPPAGSGSIPESLRSFFANPFFEQITRCRGRICPDLKAGVILLSNLIDDGRDNYKDLQDYKNSLQRYIGYLKKDEEKWPVDLSWSKIEIDSLEENIKAGIINYVDYAPEAGKIFGTVSEAGSLENLLNGEKGVRARLENCVVPRADWDKILRFEITPKVTLSCPKILSEEHSFSKEWTENWIEPQCIGLNKPCGEGKDTKEDREKLLSLECQECLCGGSLSNWFCCQ